MYLSKKIPLLFVAISAASFSFAVSADSKVMQLEKEMSEVRTETALGTYGMLTAPAMPNIDGWNWYIGLSAIYQKARVGGTEFSYTDDSPTTVGNMPIKGRLKEIDFDWDWGLKAVLGYYFEHDQWDVNLNYMWFSTNGAKSVSPGINSTVIPLKGAANIISNCPGFEQSNFVFATIGKSQFQADFNILNLELGRNYFISSLLAVRPNWGLQSTWIDLEQVTRFSGGTMPAAAGDPAGLDVNTVQIRDNSNFWGMGPRVGLNTRWYLGCGFNIFGDASGALLFGRFDAGIREKFSLCPDTSKINLNADEHRFVPTGQFTLGLGYEHYFNDNKNFISVRIGYDAQYFWRTQQFIKIDDFSVMKYARYSEDVAVYGLTIDARLSF